MTDTIEPVCGGGILIDRAIAAIAPIAESPKSGRPILSCIHLKNGTAYAADGFRAIAVDLPAESVDADPPLSIRAKSLADAVKSLGRNAERTTVEIVRSGDETTMNTGLAKFLAETVAGSTYPDIEAMMPRTEPVVSISFNASLMTGVLDAMSRSGVENDMVTLEIHGRGLENQRIVLRGDLPSGDPEYRRAARAIVMPMVKTK